MLKLLLLSWKFQFNKTHTVSFVHLYSYWQWPKANQKWGHHSFVLCCVWFFCLIQFYCGNFHTDCSQVNLSIVARFTVVHVEVIGLSIVSALIWVSQCWQSSMMWITSISHVHITRVHNATPQINEVAM